MASQELYQKFIDFVESDLQSRRQVVNRRMRGVLFWCFLFPFVLGLTLVILNRFFQIELFESRFNIWLILFFPVAYALYILGVEVLREIPQIFRKGGVTFSLRQTLREQQWREETSDRLLKTIPASSSEWRWIATHFETDLKNMVIRIRYLTALSGAVFFLLFQGLDFIEARPEVVDLTPEYVFAWFQSLADQVSNLVVLGIFLLLFYLSSMEIQGSIRRYLDCLGLVELKQKDLK